MNCLKGLCLRPTQNGHIVPHNLTRKGPREFVPPGSFFVFPSGIRPGLAGVFQLSAPFLEVSGRGEGDMGELQNQWHKCRVFVGMKTCALGPIKTAYRPIKNDSKSAPGKLFPGALSYFLQSNPRCFLSLRGWGFFLVLNSGFCYNTITYF